MRPLRDPEGDHVRAGAPVRQHAPIDPPEFRPRASRFQNRRLPISGRGMGMGAGCRTPGGAPVRARTPSDNTHP